ncbi:hypothetical protein GE21DRAFT_1284000 [Neurospora crassa]|nr:hypothetical protein GE21DRAFT_1284000 [Neurospora crassa]
MPPETAAQADRFHREEGQLPGTEARRKADDNRPSRALSLQGFLLPYAYPRVHHPGCKA